MTNRVLTKINTLDKKLDVVEDIEKHLEKLVEREEEDIKKVEKEELKIERAVFQIGQFAVKKSQLLELARGVAGAFLGVGLGQALGGSVNLAKTLPWINTIGILLFIFILVGILIYKHDRDQILSAKKNSYIYIFQKLVTLYLIALIVEVWGLILFNNFPGWDSTLIKALIIGSYTAMSSAVAFTLI
ncbi:MAG: hypothetical protein M1142_01590 [Patescibacteria group bacterium]|nr:hypothetical protein [Patescibacteria group bacterium]